MVLQRRLYCHIRRVLGHTECMSSHSHTDITTTTHSGCSKMVLTCVQEPLVIAIKLADRLHNMRTV